MLLSLDVASANTPNIKEHQTRTKAKKTNNNYKNKLCQKRGVHSRESSVAAPFFFPLPVESVVRSTAAASQGWWICFTQKITVNQDLLNASNIPLLLQYEVQGRPQLRLQQDGSHEPECIHVPGLRSAKLCNSKTNLFSSQKRHLSNSSQRHN